MFAFWFLPFIDSSFFITEFLSKVWVRYLKGIWKISENITKECNTKLKHKLLIWCLILIVLRVKKQHYSNPSLSLTLFLTTCLYLRVGIEKHRLQANQINGTSLEQGYNAINRWGEREREPPKLVPIGPGPPISATQHLIIALILSKIA